MKDQNPLGLTKVYKVTNPYYNISTIIGIANYRLWLLFQSSVKNNINEPKNTYIPISNDQKLLDACSEFSKVAKKYKADQTRQNANDCLLLIQSIISLRKMEVNIDYKATENGKSALDYLLETGYITKEDGKFLKIKGTIISEWKKILHNQDEVQQLSWNEWFHQKIGWNTSEDEVHATGVSSNIIEE